MYICTLLSKLSDTGYDGGWLLVLNLQTLRSDRFRLGQQDTGRFPVGQWP